MMATLEPIVKQVSYLNLGLILKCHHVMDTSTLDQNELQLLAYILLEEL